MCAVDYKLEGNLDTKSDLGIILPTYCEAANIEALICEIEDLHISTSILVIDDSSPDNTAEIVRNLQKKYKNLLLMSRPSKSGLGTAITDGFKAFLSLKSPPKYIITMDADYSHDPKDIPILLYSAKNCDLVIGSRYCKGGNALNWGILRLAISKVANLFASLRIGAKINDHTSGFRCYSLRLVKNIVNDLHSQTYEIQIETIRQAYIKNFKIAETPIVFVNRKKGKSKLSINEIKDFLTYIFNLNRKY